MKSHIHAAAGAAAAVGLVHGFILLDCVHTIEYITFIMHIKKLFLFILKNNNKLSFAHRESRL